ncbi:leucine--tRNA ligase [Patescibacteria group bacterium]|nr:leucine--tRNA ligase [Patescibacteria group bacterium]
MDNDRYNPAEIENKWQQEWARRGLHETDLQDDKRPKYYNLVMFPYPSGDKLHLGHWYNYAPADSFGRYMRMMGHNVFEPMGFDSFGLPAENYAIKTGVHPAASTAKNVEYMRMQLRKMGTMYDWDKEIVTSEPDYYKWTQWIFLQLYKKGLAYRKKAPLNWCGGCMTVLANEQVQEGHCERCNSEVEQKEMAQWFFKITDYTEQLLDHSELDWPEKTILMQKNWIGRSEGIDISYEVEGIEDKITCFTTRPDTNFGATFIVVAPESEFVKRNKANFIDLVKIEDYIARSNKKTELERIAEGGKKTGVDTGLKAINNLTGAKLPIFVSDFVLANVGTGCVVGVPGHDIRDFEFALAKGLEIIRVVIGKDGDKSKITRPEQVQEDAGIMINSEFLDGMEIMKAKEAIMDHLEKKGWGKRVVNYRLRDWLISRQRYWGAPIPIVFCDECGEVPVEEAELPVMLPDVKDYKPKGKSPLETNEAFVNVKCPKCGGEAKREVDTLDTFVCSSWYYFRYVCSEMKDKPFSNAMADKWLPVDMYIGGPEHACMHLLYARFIHKVMHDLGYTKHKEPFKKLVHQGLITKDGAKMSKSKGNTVSPDEFVENYGADVFRMYLMFMGPFTDGGDWNDKGITGTARFADKFWKLILTVNEPENEAQAETLLHKTIKKVSDDISKMQFNTCISALMEYTNNAQKIGLNEGHKKSVIKLIAPIAPHLAEELWHRLGEKECVFNEEWPTYDKELIVEDTVEIAVQVNGKVRGSLVIEADASKEKVLKAAKEILNVAKHLSEGALKKEIYVAGKIVNFVVL